MDMLAIRPFSSVSQIAEGRRRKTHDELVGGPDGTSDTLFSREGVRSDCESSQTGYLSADLFSTHVV